MDSKTLVTHDLIVRSEILKLQNLKPPYFYKLFLLHALFKNHFWPKTTENMKFAPKQEIFFCAKYENYGYINNE